MAHPLSVQGVVLTGTYKLDVGGISLYDWRDGHTDGQEVSPYDLKKTSRKLTSIGTLRISTLETTLQHGQASRLSRPLKSRQQQSRRVC